MTDNTPGTDLVYASANLDQRKGYAQSIAAAGDLLPKSLWAPMPTGDGRTELRPSPGKVFLLTETGDMLHIHPIAALNGVNIIEGKPTVSPALMRALIQRAGHKVRVQETGTIEAGDYAVTVTIVRADDPDYPHASTWTPHRGARAGLCTYAYDADKKVWQVRARSRSGNPLPWEAYTESLCLARATREAANMGASDVIFGIYTPEELGATVNEAGELIDVTASSIDRTPPVPFEQVQDAEVVEQDHDGPNVTATMRSTVQPKRADPKPTTRDHAEVLTDWASRIGEVDDLDQLIKLHAEAADRHVLDHADNKGVTIEDVFLARREAILTAQAQESATDDGSEDYADEELPF